VFKGPGHKFVREVRDRGGTNLLPRAFCVFFTIFFYMPRKIIKIIKKAAKGPGHEVEEVQDREGPLKKTK